MKNRPYYLYTLNDPTDGVVKYVGCTINPKSRFSLHLNELSNKRKCEWIAHLKSMGLKPIMNIVARTNDLDKAILFEKLLFDQHDFGNLLCNNPRRSPYVKKHDVEKLTVELAAEKSNIIFDNIKKLFETKGVTEESIKKGTHISNTLYLMNMNKNHVFLPYHVHPVAKYFNVSELTFIVPNYNYAQAYA
jgi:hypothetical protein